MFDSLLVLSTGMLLALSQGAAEDALADQQSAERRVARAEELVRDGFHETAYHLYREIARQYPETDAGRTAARRIQKNGVLGWAPLELSGPSSNRVDVVVMGDGYTLSMQDQFDDIARVVPRLFEHDNVLGEYLSYFDFWRMNVVSAEDGLDGFGRKADTALGGHVRGTFEGHVGVEPELALRALEQMPEHDRLAIVYVQRGSHGTGYPGVAAIGGRQDATTIHELGHAFGRLQDEYARETGHRGAVSSSINVSAVEDPEQVPWRHWLEARVPGIGVYEGADGRVRGAWKPTASGCVMEDGEFFCRVCREALVLRIYSLVDPLEEATPYPHGLTPPPLEPPPPDRTLAESEAVMRGKGPHEFAVRVLRPANHALEIRWWIVPERGLPLPPKGTALPSSRTRDRTARGALQRIYVDPARTTQPVDGTDRFTVLPAELDEPGLWRVICRVRDTTELRGERWPWVLRDPSGVLESEVGWWVVVD